MDTLEDTQTLTIAARKPIEHRIRGIVHSRLAIGFLFLLHLGATCHFFPPTEVFQSIPLYTVDYPVHTYRVHVYREALFESGLPWGYNPDIAAGSIMTPAEDVGAKPMQVLGVLLPFLSAGAVVRLFLFLAVLTFPLWMLLACRRLGLDEGEQVWVLFTLLVVSWMEPHVNGYWYWGLAAFAAASYFSIYVLARFLDFMRKPGIRTYAVFGCGSALLFLLHIVGPVVIVPALVIGTLAVRPLQFSWRLLLGLVPLLVLALNAFWVVPFFAAEQLAAPPGELPMMPPDVVMHQQHTTWAELGTKIVNNRLLLVALVPSIGLALYGTSVLRKSVGRQVAMAIGVTWAFGLFLWFFGSFVPVIARMQPVRFVVPAAVFLSVPVGVALVQLVRRFGLPVAPTAVGGAVIIALGALLVGRPERLALPEHSDALVEFVERNTEAGVRLLVQSPDGYRYGDYETKAFPLTLNREVIGSNFPQIADPPQFLRTMLLGRPIEDWNPEELEEALQRWGGDWAFTVTRQAHELFAAALDQPGQPVGRYHAFEVAESADRFIVGSGRVEARINRLELSQLRAEDGFVVLRYRYHPGWYAEDGVAVHRVSVPEDPAGFIALEDPPEDVTLHFEPWAMLYAPWPDPVQKSDR